MNKQEAAEKSKEMVFCGKCKYITSEGAAPSSTSLRWFIPVCNRPTGEYKVDSSSGELFEVREREVNPGERKNDAGDCKDFSPKLVPVKYVLDKLFRTILKKVGL